MQLSDRRLEVDPLWRSRSGILFASDACSTPPSTDFLPPVATWEPLPRRSAALLREDVRTVEWNGRVIVRGLKPFPSDEPERRYPEASE